MGWLRAPINPEALKATLNIAVLVPIALAACTTVLLVGALQPTSASAFVFFAAWLVVPYVVMSAALIFSWRRRSAVFSRWCVAAVIVSAGGVLSLTDIIYWRPDAQGGIAVLMAPIFQLGALALLLPAVSWMSGAPRT